MIDIGNRLELFVDDFLIERMEGVSRQLHRPTPREVALVRDIPWEGNSSGYNTVFRDGDLYRLYYRGSDVHPDTGERTHPEFTCYAESEERTITWSGKSDLSHLAGESVRLRFAPSDADLYACRFRDDTPGVK